MSKFRKKPVVIEAVQFLEGQPIPKGVCFGWRCNGDNHQHVHTAHENQKVYVEFGDWIVPELDGEHYYPIKPAIFEATYEAVADQIMPTPSEPNQYNPYCNGWVQSL